MTNPQDLRPGDSLGRYELLLPLGHGGMASVWAARLRGSRGFTKTVALKTVLPSLAGRAELESMLLDEARLTARLSHPHAAEVLDVGEYRGLLFVVMEWIDGESAHLFRRQAGGRLPWPLVLRLGMDLCSALRAAHELSDDQGHLLGVVHRDVSPQNLMLSYQGVTKLLDFGVVKAAGRLTEETRAGTVKGKPSYMAPEQGLGGPVDGRTDLFALGVVLYELLTGKHPFRGSNGIERLRNIISDQEVEPPSAVLPDCPKGLEQVILRVLSHRPDQRFDSARQMGAAMDQVSERRVTNRDLAAFLHSTCGALGQQRRAALIDAALRAESRVPSRPMAIPLSECQTVSRLAQVLPEIASGAPVELGQRENTVRVPDEPLAGGAAHRGRQRRWTVGLALALMAGGTAWSASTWQSHVRGSLGTEPTEPLPLQPMRPVARARQGNGLRVGAPNMPVSSQAPGPARSAAPDASPPLAVGLPPSSPAHAESRVPGARAAHAPSPGMPGRRASGWRLPAGERVNPDLGF